MGRFEITSTLMKDFGGSHGFQVNQRSDPSSPTEFKEGGYRKLTSNQLPIRKDHKSKKRTRGRNFIVTQPKFSNPLLGAK